MRIGILGAGGLGKAACRIIGQKRQLRLTAICDSKGFLLSPDGLPAAVIAALPPGDVASGYAAAQGAASRRAGGGSPTTPEAFSPAGTGPSRSVGTPPVADTPSAAGRVPPRSQATVRRCDDPLGAMVEAAESCDGWLITLPNMPNTFIPGVIERFTRARQDLVFVDVLKRTAAVQLLFGLDEPVKAARSVVITGCGATPGLLTAAAVLAAQSFISVERVEIWWGVGIANWDAYKATIREDIAHLPGFSVERAQAMSDGEVEVFLAKTNGLLELHQMEHADDVLLQRVGVVQSPEQVEVGGIMDTRHAKKPVSTTMTLTGITYEGKRASHRFILGDETTMAANVIGPALGYLKRAAWLRERGIFGVFGSTEFLPMVAQ